MREGLDRTPFRDHHGSCIPAKGCQRLNWCHVTGTDGSGDDFAWPQIKSANSGMSPKPHGLRSHGLWNCFKHTLANRSQDMWKISMSAALRARISKQHPKSFKQRIAWALIAFGRRKHGRRMRSPPWLIWLQRRNASILAPASCRSAPAPRR